MVQTNSRAALEGYGTLPKQGDDARGRQALHSELQAVAVIEKGRLNSDDGAVFHKEELGPFVVGSLGYGLLDCRLHVRQVARDAGAAVELDQLTFFATGHDDPMLPGEP